MLFCIVKAPDGVDEKRNGRVGHLIVQNVGRVGDDDAAGCGMLHIHTVIANAEIGDDIKIGQRIHPFGVEAAGNRHGGNPLRILGRER